MNGIFINFSVISIDCRHKNWLFEAAKIDQQRGVAWSSDLIRVKGLKNRICLVAAGLDNVRLVNALRSHIVLACAEMMFSTARVFNSLRVKSDFQIQLNPRTADCRVEQIKTISPSLMDNLPQDTVKQKPIRWGNSGEQLKCFKSRSGFFYILCRICRGYQVFVDFFAWLLSLNNRIFDFRSLLQRQNCDRFGQKIKSWLCMSQNVMITALCETRDQETLQHWVSMMTKFGISNTREECIQLNKELSLSRSMSSSMVTWWIWWVQIFSKYLQFNVTKLGWHCTCHIGWDKRQECLGWQWVMKQLSSRQY